MIKSLTKLAVLAAFITPIQINASEPSHFYVGLGWGSYAFDIKNSGVEYGNSSGIALDLGYDFNNIVAIQASYISPDNFDATGGTNEDINYAASLFVRANLRFERSSIFFLAGGSKVSENNSSYDGNGLAYGMGVDFYGSKNTAVTLKYVRYLDADTTVGSNNVKLDGATIGFTHYFDTPRFNDRY